MSGHLRRRTSFRELEPEDGPFASFTDLLIGIIFLFLILVAALMLMHQDTVQKANFDADAVNAEAEKLSEQTQMMSEQVQLTSDQVRQMQTKVKAAAKLDAEHPAFRLAIVYNSYQRPFRGAGGDWTYSRTVQVFRAPNGLCLNNVIMRNSNLSLAWKPPTKVEDIPTPDNQTFVRMGTPCTLSAEGDEWNSDSETGHVSRVSQNIYIGNSVLHKKDGDEILDVQYRVLGIYDDHFRWG
jgi:hypothetical protein